MLAKLFQFLLRPSARYSVLLLAGGGFIAGMVAITGSLFMIEVTGTNAFCLSCHELRVAYEEYTQSKHFNNRSGVAADCVQCHLPHDYPDKLFVKTTRLKDVWYSITGSIDTREKYEAKRFILATAVWDWLDTNQSGPCRACHDFVNMVTSKQSAHAQSAHQRAQRDNRHCIECHQGVAHKMPDMTIPETAKPVGSNDAVNCSGCHADIQRQLSVNHPAVQDASLDSCLLCHVPGIKTPNGRYTFYTHMHASHKNRLGCNACHDTTTKNMKLL